jgi:hypothetical protein
MAVEQEQKAPAGRLVLLGALLALQVSGAAAFGRVLQGRWPTVQLAIAAGVSLLLAGLMERQHILLAALVSAAGFLIIVGLMVFPETTRVGLPTLATLKAMRASFAAVGRTADVQPAPALPLAPLLLAGITGVWTAAFSSHALAARARSPFLALAPPGALLAFTSLVMNDGARRLYVLPFLASALAVLFADSLWRVAQWGPLTVWHGKRAPVFGASTTTRGARRLALACLGVAIILPGILPGFLSPGLVDVQGQSGTARVSINPIVDIRARLLNNPNAEVFTVKTDAAFKGAPYWRFAVDDVFDGRTWSPSDPQVANGTPLLGGPTGLPGTTPPNPSAADEVIVQHFKFSHFYEFQLPAAYQPVAVNAPGERLRYDPTTGVLFDTNGTHPGFSYDVTSRLIVPTADQLRAVTSLREPGTDSYTTLPRTTPREIIDIAHQLADNEPTVYGKIEAIKTYLRGFQYSTSVPPGHSTNDILRFLTVTKAGYCEQFAGTMAVLLRALGIPARVAVGFTGGTYDTKDNLWRVTSGNAHAWVEVPFPGFGWLSFDPTPGRANPLATYDSPQAATDTPNRPLGSTSCLTLSGGNLARGRESEAVSQCGTSPIPPPGGSGSTLRRRQEVGPLRRGEGTAGTSPTRHRVDLLVGLLGLLVLLVLAVPAIKLGGRRLAVARAADPSGRALAAYLAVAKHAADVGLGREPAETLWEYRTRLKERVVSLDGDLDRLTGLAGRAAYAEWGVTPEDAEQAAASARAVTRTIRGSVGIGRRMVGWFRIERQSRI